VGGNLPPYERTLVKGYIRQRPEDVLSGLAVLTYFFRLRIEVDRAVVMRTHAHGNSVAGTNHMAHPAVSNVGFLGDGRMRATRWRQPVARSAVRRGQPGQDIDRTVFVRSHPRHVKRRCSRDPATDHMACPALFVGRVRHVERH